MNKQERVLLQNRRELENAKAVGMECEDMARDIKFNLQTQSDKLENSTLKNLYEMQKDMIISSRLIKSIKAARFKNKLILCGIVSMLLIACLFVVWIAIKPESSSETVVYEEPPLTIPVDNVETNVQEADSIPEAETENQNEIEIQNEQETEDEIETNIENENDGGE